MPTTQSTVTFKTPDGLQLTRQGAVPANTLLEQATEEFGEIDVINSIDGVELPDPDGEALAGFVNNLIAAKTNINTAMDQLASAEHTRELPYVKERLQEAYAALETELAELTNA